VGITPALPNSVTDRVQQSIVFFDVDFRTLVLPCADPWTQLIPRGCGLIHLDAIDWNPAEKVAAFLPCLRVLDASIPRSLTDDRNQVSFDDIRTALTGH
jgi:hypothetical protein